MEEHGIKRASSPLCVGGWVMEESDSLMLKLWKFSLDARGTSIS